MPAEPLDLWVSPPFEPEVRDGHIFARGADDDKGQSFMHAKAFEYILNSGELRCNVKFLIEGEEEIGSPSLEVFCVENKELLACDIILVSDTSMLAADMPSITTGLRGLAYWQIEVTGASRDLHSGIFGGAVANPINELSKILASLTDADGRVTIPHFYDKVQEISALEKELIAQIPFDEGAYKSNLNVNKLFGEKGFSTIERTGVRPTLDICGIWGGYTGEGSKTVLPSKAYAKLSARLVPNQLSHEIADLVADHIKSIAPEHVKVDIQFLHGAESYVCPIDSAAYKAAEKAYTKTFGIRPLPVRRGGSIGVIPIFEKTLQVKPILMGFGLESDAIHSPNENFPVDMFFKGIETIVEFYRNI
jgi:acetylornithine deacetylase/succinyl-diaminopimelate desuccinylase-like protein